MTKRVLLTVGKGSYDFIKPELDIFKDSPKVKYCLNHLTNTDHIHKALVLGGGDGAVDLALHLANQNIEVSLIHRKPDLRAKGDPLARLNQAQIKTYLDYQLIQADDHYLDIVHNSSDQTHHLDYDLIVVQYGVCPLTTPMHA